MSTDASLPTYTRDEVAAAADDLALVHDLLGGTRRMHAQSTKYILRWPDEKNEVYNIRRVIESVFGGLARTLSAAVGMLFAKAPALEWNQSEAVMKPHLDNCDAAGTKLEVFLKRFAEAAMRDGLGVLLIDHPARPKAADGSDVTITAANEGEFGLRPTWAAYGRASVRSWRTTIVNNQRRLAQLVLHECGEVDDGAFGVKSVDRYRILTLANGVASWRLLEAMKDRPETIADFREVGAGVFRNRRGQPAPWLPVAIAYCGRTDAPCTAAIPLLDVAFANLSHWQQSTELRFYRAVSAFPQPTVAGRLAADAVTGDAGKLRIGPMVAVHIEDPTGSFSWTELAGTSMDQLEKGIDEKLGQISKLGVAFLATDTRAPETAEAKRMDATAENSTLATAAQGVDDAVNLGLEIHAWYVGIEKAGAPTLALSRDYESTAMDAATMVAYVTAVKDAGLPPRILLEAWEQGGRLPEGTDIDALLLEIEARIAAQEEKERQAAEDALALRQAGAGATAPLEDAA